MSSYLLVAALHLVEGLSLCQVEGLMMMKVEVLKLLVVQDQVVVRLS